MWWWKKYYERNGNMRVGSILTEDRRGLEKWENIWWENLKRMDNEKD
jgi:hypothetical protein